MLGGVHILKWEKVLMKTIFRFIVSEVWSILYLNTQKIYQNKLPKMTIIFDTKYAQFSQIGSVPTKDLQTPPPPLIFMRDVECAE